jgi:uridine phosphorylase
MPVEIDAIRRHAGNSVVVIGEGPGFLLARRSLASFGKVPDIVVSAGICGALDSSLKVGDVFVATDVNGIPCRLPVTARTYSSGPLVSQDRVADTVEEKSRLRKSGALAVDMEAAVVAEQSLKWNVPFYCIKAISDEASDGFVLNLNAARDEQGRFGVGKILGQALRHPVSGLPELLRLKRNSEKAAEQLGEFFADCSF